jgi:nucleotide-binding universal stress UspA family protein
MYEVTDWAVLVAFAGAALVVYTMTVYVLQRVLDLDDDTDPGTDPHTRDEPVRFLQNIASAATVAPAGFVAVGWDGRKTTRPAVRRAAREAAHREMALVVVHAWSVPLRAPAGAGWTGIAAAQDAAREVATCGVAAARDAHPGLPVLALTAAGSPTRALLEASQTARLVVVGSRGRRPLGVRLGRSVSASVASRSAAPVLVVDEDGSVDVPWPTDTTPYARTARSGRC